jgi:DNA invertase Pin-like site-specific DNA recombinase
VVCVGKFDRFARSISHLLRALETFNALGIAFVSLSERVDTTTPAGKMVCTVLGAVAELERSLIVERVKAGMRNAGANETSSVGPELRLVLTELPCSGLAAHPGRRFATKQDSARGHTTSGL